MSQVFISYSRRDINFVKQLVKRLETARIDNWLDQDDIEPAADWRERIQTGIERADNFIFVISPASVQSNECRQELEAALRNGKRLIPIVYKEIDPQLTHPALASINWIFFRDGVDDFQTAFAKLVTAIKTDLAWAHVHSRIQTRALEWKRKNQDPSFLLRGKDLQDAEQQLAGAGPDKNPQPTEMQRQYVLACRQDATHRQRRNFIVVSFVLVLVFGLAIVAFILRGMAVEEANLRATAQIQAEEARSTAVIERDLKATAQLNAEHAEATAIAERDLKSTAQVNAEHAESTAVAERDLKSTAQVIAETQRDIAISRQLVAQAQVLKTEQLDLALLLAIEASRGTTDGQRSLSDMLQAEPHLIRIVSNSEDYFGQGATGFIDSLAFSPDGNKLIAKSEIGAYGFWDFNTYQSQELDSERYQQHLDAWAAYQIPPPALGDLFKTLDTSTLYGTPSAVLNRVAFPACRTISSAGGAPGCASQIYIFEAEYERLISPLASCDPTEKSPDFQIELEGGLYHIWDLQSATGQTIDLELYSVVLANKATNNGSELVDALYDPQTNRLTTVAAVGRFGSELALIVWDLSDKKPIIELFYRLWDSPLAQINFYNGGAALDVCGSDKSIQIDIDPESWQTQACEIAGRNFNQIEWAQYISGEEYRLTCPQWPAGE